VVAGSGRHDLVAEVERLGADGARGSGCCWARRRRHSWCGARGLGRLACGCKGRQSPRVAASPRAT
jgi:hypothetical protein